MGHPFKALLLSLLLLSSSCTSIANKIKTLEEPEEPEIKQNKRRAGILMHITSLPSKYGIGTLGQECFDFIDFLKAAKQKCWQMLPINPTSYGDSPYQALSSFAGNHYLIDLDILIKEKLLKKEEVTKEFWGKDPSHVDFGNMFVVRNKVLRKAFDRFKPNAAYKKFLKDNSDWLDDYALFMSLKEHFDYKPWGEWPKDIRNHQKSAIEKYKKELNDRMDVHRFLQFKFDEQFVKVKEYAKKNGIKLIGDVPIYVPQDSSDAWANPENFQLDEEGNPTGVAGVPPDAFTADGQLWGNPLYDWKKMEATGFKWWIKRLRITSRRFDIIRIDHFRGLESYWNVPYGDKTAKNGKWVKGPDKAFLKALHENLSDIEFIAEDLGYLTPEVKSLLDYSKFPGMKVLQFAFDTREPSNYLPHTYTSFSVCYPGTHDNDTLMTWQKVMRPEDRRYAEKYLGLKKGDDLRLPIIRAGMMSVSDLFICQLQDYLGFGAESRMNRPGIMDGKNWTWRLKPNLVNFDNLAEEIAEMTVLYGRN